MSLALLWPAALLGLLALAVPLLLHRLPRRDSLPRRFAALRFIGAHAAPHRRRRISEWPLLCLRLALLATLALWLAAPQWLDWPGRGLHWQAFWPGLTGSDLANAPPADRRVWLLPGFPAVGAAAEARRSDSASLLRELAATLPPGDRLSVWVPATLDGLDGERLQLARAVEWNIVDTQAAQTPTPAARRLALRSEPDARAGAFIEAALAALEADPKIALQVERGESTEPVPADADGVLWIGDRPAPRWQGRAVPVLQVPGEHAAAARSQPLETDPHSGLPWRRLPDGTAQLAAAALPAQLPAVLDADFPRRLHHLLFHRDARPARAAAEAVQPGIDPQRRSASSLPLSELLAMVAALLLLAERWLASGRRLRGAR